MKGTPQDFTGRRFGRLVVLSLIPGSGGYKGKPIVQRKWVCLCDCGKETISKSANLRNGYKKSCGCLNDEYKAKFAAKHKPEVIDYYGRAFCSYKQQARNRGLTFQIPRDEFSRIVSMRCVYCNAKPSNYSAVKDGRTFINGIDRIDNSVGYVEGNIVPCCSQCNWAKKDMSAFEYVQHCRSVVYYQRRLNGAMRKFGFPSEVLSYDFTDRPVYAGKSSNAPELVAA